MTLPPIKLGQLWQCRAQRYRIKIGHIEGDKVYVMYKQNDGQWPTESYYQHYSAIECDGVYPTTTGMREFDIATLLYDPST
jgi:hypothetical protein